MGSGSTPRLMACRSPFRSAAVIAFAVLVGDVLLSGLLDMRGPMTASQAAAVDALTLFLLVGVTLYFFVLRPLNRELVRRSATEETLAQAKTDLEARVQERTVVLERRNSEIRKLVELAEAMQACHTQGEAGGLVARAVEKLFPGTLGALFLYSPSRNDLEAIATWGGVSLDANDRIIAPAECWGLRRGRAVGSASTSLAPPCRHLPAPAPGTTLCMPMTARGDVLGLVHFCGSPGGQDGEAWDAWYERLAVAFTDQVAITLANLQLRERLHNQSIRDPLTGLFNRRYMEETLGREIVRAERSESQVGVVLLDLDRFKQFNDTCGHAAGDRLLQEFGQLLSAHLRGSDVACRYGGEEFALILPDMPAPVVMERLELLRARTPDLTRSVRDKVLEPVTMSAGVAFFPQHGHSGETLLGAADRALYRAKAAGRDRVVVVDDRSGRESRSAAPRESVHALMTGLPGVEHPRR